MSSRTSFNLISLVLWSNVSALSKWRFERTIPANEMIIPKLLRKYSRKIRVFPMRIQNCGKTTHTHTHNKRYQLNTYFIYWTTSKCRPSLNKAKEWEKKVCVYKYIFFFIGIISFFIYSFTFNFPVHTRCTCKPFNIEKAQQKWKEHVKKWANAW